MNTKLHLIVLMCCISNLQAEIKCWKNDDNIKECGDVIPPEFIQYGHQTIDHQGIIRDEIDREKTTEELDQEAEIKKQQQEKERLEADQDKKDEILLKTFATVEDIERARDDRISIIDSSIKLTENRNQGLIDDIEKQINLLENQDESETTERIVEKLESLKSAKDKNDNFIKNKRQEKEKIKAEHDKDIERFKYLKNLPAD